MPVCRPPSAPTPLPVGVHPSAQGHTASPIGAGTHGQSRSAQGHTASPGCAGTHRQPSLQKAGSPSPLPLYGRILESGQVHGPRALPHRRHLLQPRSQTPGSTAPGVTRSGSLMTPRVLVAPELQADPPHPSTLQRSRPPPNHTAPFLSIPGSPHTPTRAPARERRPRMVQQVPHAASSNKLRSRSRQHRAQVQQPQM